MKLALKRGCSLSELFRTTSISELQEYQALNVIEPLFEDRFDFYFANLMTLLFNAHATESTTKVIDEWPQWDKRIRDGIHFTDITIKGDSNEQIEEQLDAMLELWMQSGVPVIERQANGEQ